MEKYILAGRRLNNIAGDQLNRAHRQVTLTSPGEAARGCSKNEPTLA
jgi:hypothetical protein